MNIFDKIKKTKEAEKKSSPAEKNNTVSDVKKKDAAKKSPAQNKAVIAKNILIEPIVSEKATALGAQNSYVFEVHPDSNKIEIKKAIEAVYRVTPLSVNIVRVSGKYVTHGKTSGRTKNWKKAIVTLKQGDKIQIYEGI
ncbi:50S ribosomal protein L23 [Candidatus Parcubacteria bacterium]|nr:MAG: 50S ribosomal protein L23 [Candidatus Parcubacteria bacterium]